MTELTVVATKIAASPKPETNNGRSSDKLQTRVTIPTRAPHIEYQGAISVMDSSHQEVGVLTSTDGLVELDSDPVGGLYIKLGKGDKVFVTPTIADALALHNNELGNTTTIAPLKPDSLIELSKILRADFPDHSYILFGAYEHQFTIAACRELLEAPSFYPTTTYPSWDEFIKNEGIFKVKDYIQNRNDASRLTEAFVVTPELVEGIEEQRVIFENLIISQHITVICAEPGAGKTTILNWVCSQISETIDVHYINADCSGSDLKNYHEYAHNHGFRLINFDIHNRDAEEFFEALESSENLSHQLYILDTLKQFSDLMSKSSVKNLLRRLRRLCNKGATFVLLAHTNKHKDKEGKPIFEGVGDVKNDSDELIYLIPVNNSDGSKSVSTLPDKKRGNIEPITFLISSDRGVSMTDYVDTRGKLKLEADSETIQAINEAIANGCKTQKSIIEACQVKNISKRTTLRVMERYDSGENQIWTKLKGDNNSWDYTLK